MDAFHEIAFFPQGMAWTAPSGFWAPRTSHQDMAWEVQQEMQPPSFSHGEIWLYQSISISIYIYQIHNIIYIYHMTLLYHAI